MTDKAISPLRRRMIEDMMIRKLVPKTQQGYIRNVKAFAAFLGRSPGTATNLSRSPHTTENATDDELFIAPGQ